MLLYLLRHGDAIQTTASSDSERPLSDLGKQQAAIVGSFLRSTDVTVDKVISSPLVRAVDTATIVAECIHATSTEQTEYLVPGTRKAQLLDFLSSDSPKSVLLVGHEPHLSETASLLLTETTNLRLEFKKCALMCLLASDPVRQGHAMLQWFLTPDQMRLLQR